MNKNLLKMLKAILDNNFTVESTFSSIDFKYQYTVFKSNGEDLFISSWDKYDIGLQFSLDLLGYIIHNDTDYIISSSYDIDDLKKHVYKTVKLNYKDVVV